MSSPCSRCRRWNPFLHSRRRGPDAAARLVFMAIDAEKSLCYQLRPVVTSKTCIVISPLSQMQVQVFISCLTKTAAQSSFIVAAAGDCILGKQYLLMIVLKVHLTLTWMIYVKSLAVKLLVIQRVWEVVSKFDHRKKNLVQSIGFGGILDLPHFKHSNNQFTLWLLSKIRWYSGRLVVGDTINLTITPEHIGKIISISCSGLDVAENCFKDNDEKTSFARSRLSFLGSDQQFVKLAEDFVESGLHYPSSKEDEDKFKVAFVIFIMGRFLAPTTDHSSGRTDFWCALSKPDEIGAYNWSSYVMGNIFEAARTVTWDTLEHLSVLQITGCSLIIQILYLDMIDFGPLSLKHVVFPRVKHFTSDLIIRMIESDICPDESSSAGFTFGRIKAIRKIDNCYITSIRGVTTATYSTSHHVLNSMSNASGSKLPVNSSASPSGTKVAVNTSPASSSSFPLGFETQISPTPLLDTEVLDFSAFIRKKYQGQIEPPLIEALRLHNARCLQHIHKYSRACTAALVKENINFAVKYIDHHNNSHANHSSADSMRKLEGRRRSSDDMLSGTESGNDEGKTSNPKIPRVRTHGTPISKPTSKRNGLVNVSSTDEMLASPRGSVACSGQQPATKPHGSSLCQFPNKQMAAYGTPKNTVKHDCLVQTAKADSKLKGSHLPCSKPYSSSNLQASSSAGILNQEIPAYTMPKHTAQVNFETPDPSMKMCSITPRYSPTTENKLFAGADLSLKMLSTIKSLDLNAMSIEAEYSNSPLHKKEAQVGSLALSHWALGLDHPPRDLYITHKFFDWLSTTNSDELYRCWIMHEYPRFIEIKGNKMKEEFTNNRILSDDVFDISIRRIGQLDKDIYAPHFPLCWRHLFESDFATHVLAEENPVSNVPVREQFVGSRINYELSRCRMFFVPVRANGIWWCYAWDLKNNTVFIIDPLVGDEKDDVTIKRHCGTIDLLSKSLSQSTTQVFSGWTPSFNHCRALVLRTVGMPCERSQTGFFTLFCIKNFDGAHLTLNPSELNLHKFKEYMLHEVLELNENRARLPAAFVHIID